MAILTSRYKPMTDVELQSEARKNKFALAVMEFMINEGLNPSDWDSIKYAVSSLIEDNTRQVWLTV